MITVLLLSPDDLLDLALWQTRRGTALELAEKTLSAGSMAHVRYPLKLGLVVALLCALGRLAPLAAEGVQVWPGLCVAARHERGGVRGLRRGEGKQMGLWRWVSNTKVFLPTTKGS